MPYALRGNKVVRSDTGEVVKDHGSDHAKAVRHLRALKANVEEGSPAVLGALLEGAFDEARHPRGFHGRWIRGRGGRPGRLEGTYNGVKLERGVAYQGELAGGKVFTGHWTGEVQGFGRDGASAQEPIFRHVDDPTMRRTFSGGKFFGRLADVKPSAPNEQRSDEMASGPLRRVSAADIGRAAPPTPITGPSVAVTTNDGRRISVDAARREQTDYHAAHGKPSPFLPSHVKPYTAKDDPAAKGASTRTTDRLANVRGLEDAGRKAQATRAEILAKSPSAQRELDQYRSVQRGAAQPQRGAAVPGVAGHRELHAALTRTLSSLPVGRFHSSAATGGHVRRTAQGFEVYGHSDAQPRATHKTPSAAAGHLLRLARGVRESEERPEVLGALLERDFSAERRRTLAKTGAAMSDGSFPIVSGGDLDSAIKLARTPAQRAHVKKRAKAIGQTGKIPAGWG